MCNTSLYNMASQTTDEAILREIIDGYGVDNCVNFLKQMMLIREFEVRGEEAYLEGLVGGFYHSYSGQEAVATAALANTGKDHWFFASYRCHAVAILLGIPLKSLAAELLGKETGCALGRGGSMHMCGPNFPGGFGIVGGQIPLAAGAAFAIKYRNENKISLSFIGDGAVAQGVFHETMNFASLHDLPLMLVIENNGWGMGTALHRAIAKQPLGESQATSYGIPSVTINGFDLFNALLGFQKACKHILETGRPIIVECLCSRFRGHSISDPNLYRTKEEMQCILKKDPIIFAKDWLVKMGILSEDNFKQMRQECRDYVLQAFSEAKSDPEPSILSLEEGVYA
ncbi:pyruvate dehydrogenase (acetyl-transferring) E1 component, alpha subunit [Chlamydia ibidis]|uniref:Pyruvate dehydrogenase E1 component subunit alpha n=2 Tax=Chlamydia ibidis TaxID=1405396 RepID=S7J618_9CHLA|nr:pyruvate dehydrogenase (acetyl-transferring) E1 component subunit alpha [Chlamydia ibidis]EPP35622.1 pyruvate dehydrogenase (acetyl-transferring) E1 component, alpha subunit [Chlamydia ibidis]EQM62753.1 pyruvate dehydrogenase (acetyl-transferring) E1 component, alpha subunit [Chlamydia ibidis 10-1398/6]